MISKEVQGLYDGICFVREECMGLADRRCDMQEFVDYVYYAYICPMCELLSSYEPGSVIYQISSNDFLEYGTSIEIASLHNHEKLFQKYERFIDGEIEGDDDITYARILSAVEDVFQEINSLLPLKRVVTTERGLALNYEIPNLKGIDLSDAGKLSIYTVIYEMCTLLEYITKAFTDTEVNDYSNVSEVYQKLSKEAKDRLLYYEQVFRVTCSNENLTDQDVEKMTEDPGELASQYNSILRICKELCRQEVSL